MFTLKKCDSTESMALLGGLMCPIGRMVGVALWQKGTVIPTNFGKTQLDTLVQDGKFLGAIMADGIENNDTDPTYKDSLMKVRSQTDRGRKGFALSFERPPAFQNQLEKLNGSENWDFTPILDDGSIFAYTAEDGDMRGFPSKLFVGLYKLPILGVDEYGSRLEIDLLPKALIKWQSAGVVLTNDEIDFMEVNPVAPLNMQMNIMTNKSTVSTARISNLSTGAPIVGLDDAENWNLKVNGELKPIEAVSYDPNSQEYSFSHEELKAGDTVSLVTNRNGSDVYPVDSNYYSGTSEETKVV